MTENEACLIPECDRQLTGSSPSVESERWDPAESSGGQLGRGMRPLRADALLHPLLQYKAGTFRVSQNANKVSGPPVHASRPHPCLPS